VEVATRLQTIFLLDPGKFPMRFKFTSLILLFTLVSLPCGIFAQSPAPPATFAFQQDDIVAIYGNGLADRMQHSPWDEAVLQSQLKGLNVSFRNMSFSGDVDDKRPRNQGFLDDKAYQNHVNPSVIFTFFGYNESFDGADGASKFETRLVKLIEQYRAWRKEAGTDARFVLFSPIAFENTGDPNLPDGVGHNENLAAFTAATKQAAEAAGVTFVDLYTPTLELFAARQARYTINGAHLNDAGYRKLADIISKALLGKTVPDSPELEKVLAQVKDKNWHWHNRYRATDGNDVWGGRSKLAFVDGQTNADVLMHELVMLDVLTANRDRAIWAAAAGREHVIDDSNVPPPIPVKSNVGGGSKSSSADKEGILKYLSPEESVAATLVPDGFELNVFASEKQFPDFANPVQMQVDAKGRIWAASWNTYPKWEPGKEMNDSLMIFEDTNNDGRADKRTIFAHIHNPLGFEFWNGGVLVTSGPDLWFLKDTDGDDVADHREIVLQGLGTADTHHAANNLVFGPDGSIYWQSGIFLVHNHEFPWGRNLNTGASGMYRFNPRRFTVTPHAANSPNPHGTSFDRWGYCYANDGTGGNSFQVRPEGNGFKMHLLFQKEFRPVAANAILSSAHFADDLQDNFLICNTIGFLGVKEYQLHRDGDGAKRQVGEVYGTPGRELLKSTDKNFRPTDAVIGADGALYVSDWQNVIIGHMQHNIRDPNRDHVHGRIVRLTQKGRPLQEPVKIHGEPIETLLENLKHPIDGIRHRSRVELSAREPKAIIEATRQWMQGFNPNDEQEAHHLLEALWIHQEHGVKDQDLLNKLLNSSVPHAVVAASTVKHFWEKVEPSGASQFAAAAEREPVVKFTPPKHLAAADQKTYMLGSKVFAREAHCMTCHQANGQGLGNVYPTLIGSPWVIGNEDRLIKLTLHGVWGKMDVSGQIFDPALGVPPMTAFHSLLNDQELAAVLTFVRNSWGNKASIITPEQVKAVREANLDRSTVWDPDELLAVHPLEADLQAAAVAANPHKFFSNDELEKELLAISPTELAKAALANGDAKRGKELFYGASAACFVCHDPPGAVNRLAPKLTEIPATRTPEELVDALLRPSDLIDDAYAQVKVATLDGRLITGIKISENDKEVVLQDPANPKPVVIAKDDIDVMEKSKLSAMPAGLVKLLKDRQQFDDLMKYIIESKQK